MAYIGKGVIGVEHPSTSALTATSVTSTGAVSGTTGAFSSNVNVTGTLAATTLTGNGSGITNAGKVLQCLHTSTTSTVANTTTTFADLTGMTLTITPAAINSLIFITASISFSANRSGNVDMHASTQLLRDSTVIAGKDIRTYDYGVGGIYIAGTLVYTFVDQPETTSAVVYKFQGRKVAANTAASTMNPESGNRSEMCILEITP